ncbi:MAG: hypothetical protein K1X75_08700 [Leptospirales bacterium]|nr:hypothetical protein [Leptospirales bacterium]
MILRYFHTERVESLFFVAAGAMAIALALWFWFGLRKPFAQGAAIPLALIALIQLLVGVTVFVRTPADIARADQIVNHERARLASEEIPRMDKVMQNFVYYRWTEAALAGVALFLLLGLREFPFWNGLGAGLLAQSILMLFLDFFAERRGAAYLEWLQGLAG